MAASLAVQVTIVPSGNLTNTYGYDTVKDNISNTFPQITTALSTGSGNLQAQNWAIIASTIPANSYQTIDLTNVANVFGSVNLSVVKAMLFELTTQDGNLHLIANSSAAANPFNYFSTDFYTGFYMEQPFAGWPTASHNNFILTNPTASAITYSGWIVGY